ncbi:MAG: hypothetical protein FWH27_10965 [Planctomycetaceae bacterium]|nr:hypothetical protein [Planctomycetaceae bacterium]
MRYIAERHWTGINFVTFVKSFVAFVLNISTQRDAQSSQTSMQSPWRCAVYLELNRATTKICKTGKRAKIDRKKPIPRLELQQQCRQQVTLQKSNHRPENRRYY